MTTPIDPSASEIVRTDRAFRDTVSCVVRYQPGRTRTLLDTVPGSQRERSILWSFQSRLNTCYDGYRNQGRSLGFADNLLRGAIAEVFYRREFPNGMSPTGEIAADLASAWTSPRAVEGGAQAEMLHAMARCVVVRQPAGVGAMLATSPLSAEERSAIRVLQADLSACLNSGVQFEASRQSLRALLAEAALHYGEALRDGFGRIGRVLADAD